MRKPCSRKMRRTWPGSTPKLIMTAMSRVFSMTIMVRAMRMLRAATMHDEGDDDERDDLLELERGEELAVLLDPVGGHVALAGGLLDLFADFRGAVEVVHFEADDGEQVGLAEQALRVG